MEVLENKLVETEIGQIPYDTIHEKARPYLNTRYNEVHIALSYDFAKRLLNHYPEADEEVVLTAVILHDVGWKMVPEDKQAGAFGPNVTNAEMQRFHEVESVRIATEILGALNYSEEKSRHIIAIIDGHDTREHVLSLEDKLVKDADKLWRYTPVGVNIDHKRFGIDRGPYLAFLEDMINVWFLTPEARRMAAEALEEARKFLLPQP